MSSRKFMCYAALLLLAFFSVFSFGCGGGSGDGSGFSLFTFNVNNVNGDTGMPDDSDSRSITYITNNTYNTEINNITYNDNSINTVINVENNIYDNSKTIIFSEITRSEDIDPIPNPVPQSATILSVFAYKAGSVSGDGTITYIPNAIVVVSWDAGTESKATNGNGAVSFDLDDKAAFVDLEEGKFAAYTVTVNADGYTEFTGEVSIEEGTQKELQAALVTARRYASGVMYARDAQTNNIITAADVKIFSGWDASGDVEPIRTGITDTEGKYSYSSIETGYYTVEMSRTNYMPTRFNVSLEEGANEHNGYLSLNNLETPNDFRVVLTWGIYPTDLDSHLYGKLASDVVHVYYAHKTDSLSGETINLDRDDVTSYGPETTTFTINPAASYEYFIHWYSYASSYDWSMTEVKIDLYRGNTHVATYTAPAAPDDTNRYRYWRVFKIVNGAVEDINTYSSTYSHITSDY